jgi:hypothetical protein
LRTSSYEARARAAIFGVLGLLIAGCAGQRGAVGEAEAKQLQDQSYAAARKCDITYSPNDAKVAAARAKCHTEAWNILRPTMPYPEVLDKLISKRIEIGQKVQNGEMTLAQANAAIEKARADAAAEEQQRRGAGPLGGISLFPSSQ